MHTPGLGEGAVHGCYRCNDWGVRPSVPKHSSMRQGAGPRFIMHAALQVSLLCNHRDKHMATQ